MGPVRRRRSRGAHRRIGTARHRAPRRAPRASRTPPPARSTSCAGGSTTSSSTLAAATSDDRLDSFVVTRLRGTVDSAAGSLQVTRVTLVVVALLLARARGHRAAARRADAGRPARPRAGSSWRRAARRTVSSCGWPCWRRSPSRRSRRLVSPFLAVADLPGARRRPRDPERRPGRRPRPARDPVGDLRARRRSCSPACSSAPCCAGRPASSRRPARTGAASRPAPVPTSRSSCWRASRCGSCARTGLPVGSTSGGIGGIDPVLVLAPALVLLAGAVLALRLVPIVTHVGRAARRPQPGVGLAAGGVGARAAARSRVPPPSCCSRSPSASARSRRRSWPPGGLAAGPDRPRGRRRPACHAAVDRRSDVRSRTHRRAGRRARVASHAARRDDRDPHRSVRGRCGRRPDDAARGRHHARGRPAARADLARLGRPHRGPGAPRDRATGVPLPGTPTLPRRRPARRHEPDRDRVVVAALVAAGHDRGAHLGRPPVARRRRDPHRRRPRSARRPRTACSSSASSPAPSPTGPRRRSRATSRVTLHLSRTCASRPAPRPRHADAPTSAVEPVDLAAATWYTDRLRRRTPPPTPARCASATADASGFGRLRRPVRATFADPSAGSVQVGALVTPDVLETLGASVGDPLQVAVAGADVRARDRRAPSRTCPGSRRRPRRARRRRPARP